MGDRAIRAAGLALALSAACSAPPIAESPPFGLRPGAGAPPAAHGAERSATLGAAWQDAPAPPPASDDYSPNLYHRFELAVGGALYSSFDTTIRVDSSILVGTLLDLEDTLGVDSSSFVGRLDAHYAFNRRHRIALSVYDIIRDGTRVVSEDIAIGEVILPAGEFQTEFETLVVKLAYRYNFVQDYRTTIGASLGLHVMGIDFETRSSNGNVSESFVATAPLPVVGVHGDYALSSKWRLSASAELLRVDLGAYAGFIADTRLNINHDTFEHFGWGFGYNQFVLDADIEGEGPLRASIEYSYAGLMLYVRTFF